MKHSNVQSRVSATPFRVFLCQLNDSEVTITSDNISHVGQLSGEFELRALASKVEGRQWGCALTDADTRQAVRGFKSATAEQWLQHECEMCDLEGQTDALRLLVADAVRDVRTIVDRFWAEAADSKRQIDALEEAHRELPEANDVIQ
jgi:hypothetical protein